MHQPVDSNKITSSIIIIVCGVLSLSHGGSLKAGFPSQMFGSTLGGWNAPISSTSTGYSGLAAAQQGDSGQTITLVASGQGMVIGVNSVVGSDAFTNVAQSGGNSGESSADVSNSSGTSEIIPQSTIQLELLDTDSVYLELDSHALGWEQVDSAVEQQAQVISGQGGAGGWEAATSTGGWPSIGAAAVASIKNEN